MTQPDFWIESQPPCPAIVFNFSQSLPEEIARFDSKGFYYKGGFIDDAGEVHRLLKKVLEGQLNIATPPPEPLRPIPVSERLPEAGDCDTDGSCWVHQPDESWPESPEWKLMRNKYVSTIYGSTHWLPYNAIPFPEVTQ